ncbi:MAG: IS3 family transposase [Bacteroidota bacterium]
MKAKGYHQGVAKLAGVFGYSRQNYYQCHNRLKQRQAREQEVLAFVRSVRCEQKRIGTIKLHRLISDHYGSGYIGRDALYELLRRHKLLIRRPKRYRPKLTDGNGKSIYPDYRKGLKVSKINELWSSDITYLYLQKSPRYLYLCCIVDEYSHLIVGYQLSTDMKAKQVLSALAKGIDQQLPSGQTSFNSELILHTDRGSQFKSKSYQTFTRQHGIRTSMCAAGKSHENPVSERLNGILKNELLGQDTFNDVKQAQQAIDRAIFIYNDKRPHLSCELLTPRQAHQQGTGPLKKLWRQRKTHKTKTTAQH